MTPTVTDTQIGARIVELREQRGLSQGELSTRLRSAGLNWSQGTLSRVELGQRPIRLSECAILTLVLRTDIPTLLGGAESDDDPLPRLTLRHLPQLDSAADRLGALADQLERACADIQGVRQAVRATIEDFEEVAAGSAATLEESLARSNFGRILAERGVTTVALNEAGQIVEHRPDGTTAVLREPS